MTEIETDERGRITIPKSARERFGERYRLVELRDGLKLVPIPEDPVRALREAGSDALRSATVEELQDAARDEGEAQATENVR